MQSQTTIKGFSNKARSDISFKVSTVRENPLCFMCWEAAKIMFSMMTFKTAQSSDILKNSRVVVVVVVIL